MDSSKFLTEDEQEYLLKACSGLKNRRDALIVLIAFKCGLRASEVLNLTHRCLNHQNRTIRVLTLKRGIPRTLPAPQELFDFADTVKTDKIFDISYRRLAQIWDDIRPNGKTFHSLRHTFAFNCRENKTDVPDLQKMLGHRSLASTGVYLDKPLALSDMRRKMGL